jgi:2-dehydropantoate 2-reductase
MHIVVFGAGGVGGYFGGRLARAGEKVTFIARDEHLQAMLANGLRVESIKGDFMVQPVNATDDTSQVTDVDVVLVCVKAWQVPKVAKAIIPLLGPDTFIIPLENGLEAPSQLAEILGREYVLGGACGIFSHIAAPGLIRHTGSEPWINFGELDNHPSSRTQNFLSIIKHAGISAEIPPDINLAMWRKFLFVSAFSGIGAVTRVPVGILRSQPGTRQMLIDALQECYSVATAHGINLSLEWITDIMAAIDRYPPQNIPSLQRDIMAGRPSELEAQIGAVVHLGKMHNIPTPLYTFIYFSLLPQEALARGETE